MAALGLMRKFVFYTRAPESVQSRFAEISNRITTHKLQLIVQPDKTWQVYKQLG